MSSDDEIAVVYNKKDGKWYVACVIAGNIDIVLTRGEAFAIERDAINHAKNLQRRCGTEYGIMFYEDD